MFEPDIKRLIHNVYNVNRNYLLRCRNCWYGVNIQRNVSFGRRFACGNQAAYCTNRVRHNDENVLLAYWNPPLLLTCITISGIMWGDNYTFRKATS